MHSSVVMILVTDKDASIALGGRVELGFTSASQELCCGGSVLSAQLCELPAPYDTLIKYRYQSLYRVFKFSVLKYIDVPVFLTNLLVLSTQGDVMEVLKLLGILASQKKAKIGGKNAVFKMKEKQTVAKMLKCEQ